MKQEKLMEKQNVWIFGMSLWAVGAIFWGQGIVSELIYLKVLSYVFMVIGLIAQFIATRIK
ncbi:unnamed protein product [marine sediment metagenome]|uniref:Uncharacterized protein n=1 Tax=marine sediment metagenome TaxID=412755 RepID=X0XQE3_9ZZZZ